MENRAFDGEYRELTPMAVATAIEVDRGQPIGRAPVVLPAEEGEPLWERVQGESMAWYERFEAYRTLPLADRSVTRACRRWYAEHGRTPPVRPPTAWTLTA